MVYLSAELLWSLSKLMISLHFRTALLNAYPIPNHGTNLAVKPRWTCTSITRRRTVMKAPQLFNRYGYGKFTNKLIRLPCAKNKHTLHRKRVRIIVCICWFTLTSQCDGKFRNRTAHYECMSFVTMPRLNIYRGIADSVCENLC